MTPASVPGILSMLPEPGPVGAIQVVMFINARF
jgi:hypothetical protein